LSDIVTRHRIIGAIEARCLATWQVHGSKQKIEQRELTGEVRVERLPVIGVVPMVKLRRCEDPAQGTEPNPDVRVNEKRLPAVHHGEQKHRLGSKTQGEDRNQRGALGQNLVDGMHAMGGQPVHFLDAVMDGVEPPQPWNFVKGAMDEVEAQVSEQQDLDKSEPGRLSRDGRPNGGRNELGRRQDRQRQ
jgi:hypothetical protein